MIASDDSHTPWQVPLIGWHANYLPEAWPIVQFLFWDLNTCQRLKIRNIDLFLRNCLEMRRMTLRFLQENSWVGVKEVARWLNLAFWRTWNRWSLNNALIYFHLVLSLRTLWILLNRTLCLHFSSLCFGVY